MNLMSYSGGLLYHWRARRYSRSRWTSHLEGVRHWLAFWKPRARHLVLIGPSGGYSLPPEWLRQFDSVTVVDPDPLARLIWKCRRVQLPLNSGVRTLARSDLIAGPDGNWGALREFLAAQPNHAVLFCNVLGQLEFLLAKSDSEARAYFQGLERVLEGREWASYHDRISGELAPKGAAHSERALNNEELLERFAFAGALSVAAGFPKAVSRSGAIWKSRVGPKIGPTDHEGCSGETVLADHSTGQLAPERARDYWIWELTPGRYHLIEGVYFSPTT